MYSAEVAVRDVDVEPPAEFLAEHLARCTSETRIGTSSSFIFTCGSVAPIVKTEGRLEHLFMQEGREVALTIRRNEKQVQARLKLRRLI